MYLYTDNTTFNAKTVHALFCFKQLYGVRFELNTRMGDCDVECIKCTRNASVSVSYWIGSGLFQELDQ